MVNDSGKINPLSTLQVHTGTEWIAFWGHEMKCIHCSPNKLPRKHFVAWNFLIQNDNPIYACSLETPFFTRFIFSLLYFDIPIFPSHPHPHSPHSLLLFTASLSFKSHSHSYFPCFPPSLQSSPEAFCSDRLCTLYINPYQSSVLRILLPPSFQSSRGTSCFSCHVLEHLWQASLTFNLGCKSKGDRAFCCGPKALH